MKGLRKLSMCSQPQFLSCPLMVDERVRLSVIDRQPVLKREEDCFPGHALSLKREA